MGVQDGYPVSAGYTNPRYISKNTDDVMSFILAFDRVASGATVSDIQAAVNKLYAATGASESTTGTVYDAPAGTISNGDSYETALSILAHKFDAATGHMHTGDPGDAPVLPASGLGGFYLLGYIEQGNTILAATGTSTNISSMFSAKTPSLSSIEAGVPVIAPNNKTRILSASSATAYRDITDASGNLVFGRVTESSGTWTHSYYSNILGVETAYSFSSPRDLYFWYQELFYPNETTPVYNPVAELFTAGGSSGGVTSIAATGFTPATGNIVLLEGSQVDLSQSGTNITIATNNSSTGGTDNLLARDVNGNTVANHFSSAYTTTATASGTTTLTNASTELQYFTGTLNQTIVLPVVSTLVTGFGFDFVNLSSGTLTINSSGSNLVTTVPAGSRIRVTCILTTGTSAASWSAVAGGTASPLTTKGDLYGYSTTNARLPVGVNGQRVMADSNATLGVRYQDSFPKNYILESDLELGATTGYATFADTAKNIPTDGTGGSPNSTISATSSSPLNGTYSLLFTKSGSANRQGEGWSYDFSIDPASQGRVIAVQLNYKVASGTFTAANGITAPLNDGTTSTNAGNSDLEFFMWDVTNSVLLPITPQVLTSNSSTSAQFKGVFQSSINSTSYRLICFVATTTTNNFTMQFDQIFVGELPVAYGYAGGDWSSYTPTFTGVGSVSNAVAYYRRLGDSIQVIGSVTLGTTSAAFVSITLPSGLVIDSTKLSITSNTTSNIGTPVGKWAQDSNSNGLGTLVTAPGTSTSLVYFGNNLANGTKLTPQLGNAFLVSSQVIGFEFVVPIAGWSSTVLMSNDTDTRVVELRANGQPQNVTANNPIIYPTVLQDTHGAYNASTGRYTVPVSGWYTIKATGASTISAATLIHAYKNGSIAGVMGQSANANGLLFGSIDVQVVAGDILDVRPDGNATSFSATATLNQINITRITGPAAIAASEKVFLQYTNNGGTAITANTTNVDWSTKVVDSHNAWSGTIFTAPRAGWYNYALICLLTASGSSVISMYINGTKKINGNSISTDAKPISGGYYMLAGDQMSFRIDSSVTLSNNANYHVLSISSQ